MNGGRPRNAGPRGGGGDGRGNRGPEFANQNPQRGGRQGRGRHNNNRNQHNNDLDNDWRRRNENHQQGAIYGPRAPQREHENAPGPAQAGGQRRQEEAYGGRQQQRQKREAFPISDHKLNELLYRPPNELVMELQLNPGWKCRLEERTAANVNDLSLVVNVFRKCLESTNRHTLLGFLRESFAAFEIHLLGSIAFLVSNPNAPVAALAYELLELVLAVVAMLPKATFQTAKTLVSVMKPHLDSLQNRLAGKPRTLEEFANEIEFQVDSVRAEEQSTNKAAGQNRKRNIHGYVVEGAAPDDFRQLDIFPTMEDIENERPFLRPNKILGPYENGHEYVDTQFRLLREDFVKPIRDGIKNYLGLPAERRKKELRGQSVRYYWNVSYRGRVAALTNQVFAFALQLSPRDYKQVNWERSKRFANGAIIGLTGDNFARIIFAVVIKRDIEMLKKGILSVECCRTEDEEYMEAGRVYSVIESAALFEAYRYNLHVLQELDTAAVPFEKYIVRVQKDIEPLELLQTGRTINLKPIMLESKDTATIVSNMFNWPSRAKTILDQAQYKAVQSAFLRELCLIQGPPGTGKTFVGLLIVETMLLNNISTKPILVVCYTNHALDQFLEGILAFTTQVVRVGGMCKNDAVNQYNLSELRVKQRDSGAVNHDLRARNARKVRYRVAQLRKDINHKQEIANQALSKLLPANALDTLSWGLLSDAKEVLEWLKVKDRTQEFLQREREETQRRAREENRAAEVRRMQQGGQDHEQEIHRERQEALRRMQEEYQSDEDGDLLIDDRDDANDQLDQRTVVERLLALGQQKASRGQDKYLEFELAASERPRLTEENALRLHQRLDARGLASLTIDERWDLYRHWHLLYVRQLEQETDASREEYSEAFHSLKEMEAEMDLAILSEARIIGMTTTGAAKYKTLYERLELEVVIVEEAAELLESHIITTLSPSTKQLILIGDHQQLRPTTTDYTLASKFNLEISLFERLIDNKLPYVRLQKQHRMRPEFIKLLVPHIYPSLDSDERVLDYPHIRGMERDLQLMHHTELESQDSENRSKSNLFECQIVTGLVDYLLVQGYAPQSITVLAMYSGQQFLIKQELGLRNRDQQPVRVTSVDNYQGEENDIVIVSFVRSNVDDSIGFLKTLNRLCVAFSRAKHGLFCVGNFTMIASKQKKFENILESVKESVQNNLQLRCQYHKRVTKIQEPKDFRKVAEGGCGEPCEFRLNCGHSCLRQCHVYDVDHVKIRCLRPCAKKHPSCGHPCNLHCGTPCGRCKAKVLRVIPECGHTVEVECGTPAEEIECRSKCERLLGCLHPCTRQCAQACVKKCQMKLKVRGQCGHMVETICAYRDEAQRVLEACNEPCAILLDCEHSCKGTCGTCCQGRLHVPCSSECGKQLICGHVCKEPCSEVCPPCQRKCDNACAHSRCTKRCGEPCPPCAERCLRMCPHQKCQALCSERCTRDSCEEPCAKKLKCGHPCIGYCTDKCPKKCRECDGDDNLPDVVFGIEDEDSRYVELDCGHVIEANGMAKWVETCLESTEISMGGITCPSCKATVKKTNRYLQHVNAKRRLIEQVKAKAFGSPVKNAQSLEQLWKDIYDLDDHERELLPRGLNVRERHAKYSANDPFLANLQKQMRKEPNPDQMKIRQWTNLLSIIREVRKHKPDLKIFLKLESHWKSLLRAVHLAIENRVGQQQMNDMCLELRRFADLQPLDEELRYNKDSPELNRCVRKLTSLKRFSEETAAEVHRLINEVKKKRSGTCLGINDTERVMILKAMELKQGHWYACPNGHVYCITECGGAMVESKCNECNAPIGGGSHRLRNDNRVATAMDGATHSVWSDHYNNMNNWRFDH